MIFGFLILLIKILNLRAIQNFKVIQSSNYNDFFIIMSDGIYYFNNINYNKVIQYEFNLTQKIESQDQFDSISLNAFLNKSFLFIAKDNYIYFFDEEDNNIKCINSLNYYEIYSSQILPDYIYNSDNYFSFDYFIVFVDINKNLNIYYYSMSKYYDIFENELISSLIFTIETKYFSCQFVINFILTCFYKKENSMFLEIKSFKLINSNIENVLESSLLLKNNRNNTNIKSIKSILSQDLDLIFTCYILDDNSTCYCFIYNYFLDESDEYRNYLDNCLSNFSSLDIISYNITNKIEYILYCFISETEINLVKLDENFKIIENGENGIYSINNSLIINCSEFYLSYLLYKSDNNKNDIYIFGNCDNIILEYELKKIKTIKHESLLEKETLINRTKNYLDNDIGNLLEQLDNFLKEQEEFDKSIKQFEINKQEMEKMFL